jgi:hypothetical protein
MSSEAVACPKCGRPAGVQRRRRIAAALGAGLSVLLAALAVFTSYTAHKGTAASATYRRAVHSAVMERVAFFYSLRANCEMDGYPEINVLQSPTQGSVSTQRGKAYPEYTRENARFDCDKNLAPAMLVFYQSTPGYHGRDSFTITIRFPDTKLWTETFIVEVL